MPKNYILTEEEVDIVTMVVPDDSYMDDTLLNEFGILQKDLNNRLPIKYELKGHTIPNTTFEVNGIPLSKSGKAWMDFSSEVLHHLETYSVPQYGDMGDDEIAKYSIETCVIQMQRYLARVGQNARQEEELRGFLKVAVYAMRAHEKLKNGYTPPKKQFVLTERDIEVLEYFLRDKTNDSVHAGCLDDYDFADIQLLRELLSKLENHK